MNRELADLTQDLLDILRERPALLWHDKRGLAERLARRTFDRFDCVGFRFYGEDVELYRDMQSAYSEDPTEVGAAASVVVLMPRVGVEDPPQTENAKT